MLKFILFGVCMKNCIPKGLAVVGRVRRGAGGRKRGVLTYAAS